MRVECPNFKLHVVAWKVTWYPSKHTNLDISYVYWYHHADAVVGKWPGGKCTLYKQDTKNYSVNNICCMFKITTFLWRTLTLHSGHISLFLETVTIKFWGPRAECRHMGPRKTNIPMLPSIKIVTSCLNLLYREFLKFFKLVTRKFNFPKYRKYKNFFVF